MTTLSDSLTQQLRHIRAQKEISVESIAEKLGMSPEAYFKIENGETELTLKRIETIAEALEVSAAELLNSSSIIFSHNTITAETGLNANAISHANTTYIGVSSEVLEKLLQRIDALEAELKASRKS